MTEYIDREALKAVFEEDGHLSAYVEEMIDSVPAADVVPWEVLIRYANYFCATVSMPEFVREAKMFYDSTKAAMDGGDITEAEGEPE